MSVAKVTLNGNVIVDMTDATAAASDITAPKTAYIADGSKATGTGEGWTADGIARAVEPSGAITLSVPYVSGYNADGIRNYAFYGNSTITSITITTYPNIYAYAFANMPALTSFSAPLCKMIGNIGFSSSGYAFQNCTRLASLDLPLLEAFGSNMFQGCTSLTALAFPNVKTSGFGGNNIFANCTALTAIDFGNVLSKLGNTSCFSGCTSLSTIVLRGTSVTPLTNTGNLANTPFASGGSGGTLYVPSSLISDYEAASNWSTLVTGGTATFAAIEGSQYENYYADGTSIT